MDAEEDQAGRIRKRRFSSARIQPTRIKKVMQSDEEIGRMIASVPVAIGSAMEHFAEKLLESAAQCVQFSSARTLTPMHIRYAILKNQHFSFLEELTKEIQIPRNDDQDQSGSSKTFTTTNTGLPSAPLTPEQLNPAHFTPIYQRQTFPSYCSNYDLIANTSYQGPVQFSKDQEVALVKNIPPVLNLKQAASNKSQQSSDVAASFNVPTLPSASKTLAENPTEQNKRKRGRPRKERKDKFAEASASTATTSSLASNGGDQAAQTPTTPEELDRILMPPPSLSLGRRSASSRESINNENSDSNCTSTRSNNSTKTSLTAV